MALNILTKEDLNEFKNELIDEIKNLVNKNHSNQKQWLRSSEVRTILKISSGTLQNLRLNGTLRNSKIGGTYFYKYEDIEKLLNN